MLLRERERERERDMDDWKIIIYNNTIIKSHSRELRRTRDLILSVCRVILEHVGNIVPFSTTIMHIYLLHFISEHSKS